VEEDSYKFYQKSYSNDVVFDLVDPQTFTFFREKWRCNKCYEKQTSDKRDNP